MSDVKQQHKAPWLACLGLALATLLVYGPVLANGFTNYDDPDYVTQNPQVRNGLTLQSIQWAFQSSHASNWHPVTWISHMLDCQLFGTNPHAHHALNLALHTLNGVLLLLLLTQMTGRLWPSTMAAGLFALHPMHVESVAWISERKDVLSLWFLLLTVWMYFRYTTASQPRARKVFYFAALVLFALGLMSKPMLVTLPFLLLLLDYWPLERMPLRLVEKIPFFALSLASGIATFAAQKTGGAMTSIDLLPFSTRLANAITAYGKYLLKLFWPAQLAVIYPYSNPIPPLHLWASAASMLLITGLVLWRRSQRPWLVTGWFWFCGTLVPVIGVIQVGSQSMADRYTYLPSIGLFIAITWLAADAFQARKWRGLLIATTTAALLGCAALTNAQARYWKNGESLFRHAVNVTSDNAIAQSCLGDALMDQGKVEEGIAHLREALRLRPAHAQTHGKLAAALELQGRYPEAVVEYREALRLQPDLFEALNNFAWMLASHPDARFRNGPEAVELGERACRLTGFQNATCIGTLAAAYAEAGRFQEAVATAKRAHDVAMAWGEKELAERNLQLLELYRSGSAYRQARRAGDQLN